MKKENKKPKIRVIVNTVLLAIVSVTLGVLTCNWSQEIMHGDKLLMINSEAPGLCFKADHGDWNEGAFVCSTDYNEEDGPYEASDKENTLFLQNVSTWNTAMTFMQISNAVKMIGTLLTIFSSVITVVYFIHNI